MPGEVPDPCRIYRIVHYENLRAIVEEGGMWCGAEMAARGLPYKQIGLRALTTNRKDRVVPCAPGGNLSEYVPWHFCPRSVMLYQIHTGQSDYDGGQEPILHIVSTVQIVEEQGLPFAFTDRHAKTGYAGYYSSVDELGKLDWDTISSRRFSNTPDDNDRSYRKAAEFLVKRFLPLEVITGIGVHSQRWKDDCDRVLSAENLRIPVRVCTGWYY